ncbi:SUN domain-containing protein, partial [Parasitella parasitica]
GECWSMSGSNGTVGITLSTKIFMDSVTLVHPSASVLLGDIINAPRVFRVFAIPIDPIYLEEDLVFLGEFEYDIHSQYKAQKFLLVENTDRVYQTVIIQFLSNWGNPNFTDIYRIKISGK